jgi:predicted TPR repeat methyltransferase
MSRIDDKALARAYNRGLKCERAGDLAAAARAYAEALRLDPEDHGGVSVRLAALRLGETPARAPMAYVTTLFDQHAEAFDGILVDQLGYSTPRDLRARLDALGLAGFARLLDLGCGTGLSGAALRDLAAHRTGVDLSEGMIEIAHDKDIYHDLYIADIEGFLEEAEESWDLIVATDVLPYLGEVGPLFAAVAARLDPGGVFAFSTETAPDADFAGRPYIVGPKQRFAHPENHLRQALGSLGMDVLEATPIVVRHDEGAPVRGHLLVARRQAAQS